MYCVDVYMRGLILLAVQARAVAPNDFKIGFGLISTPPFRPLPCMPNPLEVETLPEGGCKLHPAYPMIDIKHVYLMLGALFRSLRALTI